MKKLALLLLLLSQPAWATLAIYKYQFIDGMVKVCVYDYLGSDYYYSVKLTTLCPISLEID
jgi:hypothetical protein